MTAQRVRKHKYVEFRNSICGEDGNVLEQIDLPINYVDCADSGIMEKIEQGMDNHRGVFACLHDLIEIADTSRPDGSSEGAIDPYSLSSGHQVAAYQVGCGSVVVTGNGDKGTLESPVHVFHETSLSTTRGTFP